MSLSPFEVGVGFTQGRIVPLAGAVDGSFVFELGHEGRALEQLTIGDYAQVSHTFTKLSAAQLVRLKVLLRNPTTPAVGAAWKFSAVYGGTVYYERVLAADARAGQLNDIALSLKTIAPPATVIFKLELVAA